MYYPSVRNVFSHIIHGNTSMGGGSDDLNEILREEARHTLDHRIKQIKDTDDKAAGIFRFNMLLFGILLTIISILLNVNEVNEDYFINLWSGFRIVFLIISLFSAAFTYASSSYDIGISPNLIGRTHNGEIDDVEELNNELKSLYKNWINYNRSIAHFNTYLIMVSILSVIDGVLLLIGGSLFGILEYSDLLVEFIFLTLFLIILAFTNIFIWKADSIYMTLSD